MPANDNYDYLFRDLHSPFFYEKRDLFEDFNKWFTNKILDSYVFSGPFEDFINDSLGFDFKNLNINPDTEISELQIIHEEVRG